MLPPPSVLLLPSPIPHLGFRSGSTSPPLFSDIKQHSVHQFQRKALASNHPSHPHSSHHHSGHPIGDSPDLGERGREEHMYYPPQTYLSQDPYGTHLPQFSPGPEWGGGRTRSAVTNFGSLTPSFNYGASLAPGRRASVPDMSFRDPESGSFGLTERSVQRYGSSSYDPQRIPYGGGQPQQLHEIPTSPSRALQCFSSHSAQSTASISSSHSGPATAQGPSGPLSPRTGSPSRSESADSATQKKHAKQYAFIALPGSHIRKRPRRRYDEIERNYECNFPGCNKAYGTLNHLNAHVHMQRHGNKRTPQGNSQCCSPS